METRYRYLLVGGGMAADAAARGIREADPQGTIGLASREPDPPYNRPPLSKGLWKTGPRPMPLSRIWRNTAALGVDLLLERAITRLDLPGKTAYDDRGGAIRFEKLLLATGGDPLALGAAHERIVYFRTLADYHRLRALAETCRHIVVIGGGYTGPELAAALANLGKSVTLIFSKPAISAGTLPEALALHLNRVFTERGVQVQPGERVHGLEPDAAGVTVRTAVATYRADAVVAALGIRPNTALAERAGLAVENGIQVDSALRAGHPDVFAAGDVANFFNPTLGKRMRVEHEEHANTSGRLAGLGMAGQPGHYDLLPSFYSTLFGDSYDAVGELDPRLETVMDWQEPFQRGTVYYLRDGRVRGVLLWNTPKGLDAARRLIAEPGPFRPADLRGRISG